MFAMSFLQACTQQTPESFRYLQQEMAFSSNIKINTKMDILWVIDNSSSMDINQSKLRNGFKSFAQGYLKPYWDIRIAAITTDTYLANEIYSATQTADGFPGYLDKTVVAKGGSSSWVSSMEFNYASTQALQKEWNTNLGKAGIVYNGGSFGANLKVKNIVPNWGPTYSLLKPGIHDGPIASLCFESVAYFIKGVPNCKLRDDVATYGNSGSSKCLNPALLNTGAGETSENQCVNTILNNSIHSGSAILHTKNPGDRGMNDSQWVDDLTNKFMLNLTAGTTGHGSERGLSSLLQFLEDNESNPDTAFFRRDSLRIIVIISDEDDQSMYMKKLASSQKNYRYIPSTPDNIKTTLDADTTFNPTTHYKCDYNATFNINYEKYKEKYPTTADATLQAWAASDAGAFCCSGGSCPYGAEGTNCTSKLLADGSPLTVSVCPVDSMLIPVKTIKENVDHFFRDLDGLTDVVADTRYLTVSITPLKNETIKMLQADRNKQDDAVGVVRNVAVDLPLRYREFVNTVGNGSFEMDIGESDYSVILNKIGAAILEKLSKFTLDRLATSLSDMTVKIKRGTGSIEIIPSDKLKLEGRILTITDPALVLGMSESDQVIINYQPNSAF